MRGFFFSISGYVLAPRCARLAVKIYERLSMVASIINNIYIDKGWVVQEYLRRCKNGLWKKGEMDEALKCWNLEGVVEVKLVREPPCKELTLKDLLNGEAWTD